MNTMPSFSLIRAASVAEALAARRNFADSRFVAGGTDLVPNLRRGLGRPSALIDIAAIPALNDIEFGPSAVRIGSAVTLAHLAAAPRLAALLPALVEAALAVAGPSHRNAATLGGNLCLDTRCVYYNQSEWWRESNGLCLKYGGTLCHVAPTGKRCHAAFSGDLAPVLLALEASAELEGPEGTRHVPLEAFYIEDGAAPLALGPDEMLVAVDVPLAAARRAAYEKVRQRGAIDFPLAGVAVALERSGDRLGALNVAVTGTNSRPILIAGTDELVGMPLDEEAVRRLGKLVQQQVSPMRTTLAPAHYRRRVAAALAARLARRLYAAESEAEG